MSYINITDTRPENQEHIQAWKESIRRLGIARDRELARSQSLHNNLPPSPSISAHADDVEGMSDPYLNQDAAAATPQATNKDEANITQKEAKKYVPSKEQADRWQGLLQKMQEPLFRAYYSEHESQGKRPNHMSSNPLPFPIHRQLPHHHLGPERHTMPSSSFNILLDNYYAEARRIENYQRRAILNKFGLLDDNQRYTVLNPATPHGSLPVASLNDNQRYTVLNPATPHGSLPVTSSTNLPLTTDPTVKQRVKTSQATRRGRRFSRQIKKRIITRGLSTRHAARFSTSECMCGRTRNVLGREARGRN